MLKESGLESGVKQHSAIWEWENVVGETIARNTTPESVSHHVLRVKVASPAWRQELQFKKQDIINRLNRKLGKDTIKDIRFL